MIQREATLSPQWSHNLLPAFELEQTNRFHVLFIPLSNFTESPTYAQKVIGLMQQWSI